MLVQRTESKQPIQFRVEKPIPLDLLLQPSQAGGRASMSGPKSSKHVEPRECDERCCLRTLVPSLIALMCVGALLLYPALLLIDRRVGQAQEAVRPYMREVINHTLSILNHVDLSTIATNDVVNDARSISASATPAMQRAINQTERLLERVERLAEHPVLKLSLQS